MGPSLLGRALCSRAPKGTWGRRVFSSALCVSASCTPLRRLRGCHTAGAACSSSSRVALHAWRYMPTNTALLRDLLDRGQIASIRAPLLEDAARPPADSTIPESRMMLGLAVGDARDEREPDPRGALARARRDPRLSPEPPCRRPPYGLPSDDTQLAFWDESLLVHGGLDPRTCQSPGAERIYGMGSAVRRCVDRYRRGVRPCMRNSPRGTAR